MKERRRERGREGKRRGREVTILSILFHKTHFIECEIHKYTLVCVYRVAMKNLFLTVSYGQSSLEVAALHLV